MVLVVMKGREGENEIYKQCSVQVKSSRLSPKKRKRINKNDRYPREGSFRYVDQGLCIPLIYAKCRP